VKCKISDFKTQNLVPKWTKIKIFRGSAPDPLAGFRGPLCGRNKAAGRE